MLNKIHKAQAAAWLLLIIATIALIVLWISKTPSASTSTILPVVLPETTITSMVTPVSTESATPNLEVSVTPTPTKKIQINDNTKLYPSTTVI